MDVKDKVIIVIGASRGAETEYGINYDYFL
jgi:hypothetical protein